MDILLVEDNSVDVELFQIALSESDIRQNKVTVVNRLEKALGQIGSRHFDVVMLDLSLPDSQGMDTVEKIIAKAPFVPIIILTGSDDRDLALEALRNGAQDYLLKDQMNSQILTRIITYSIERKQFGEELRKAKEELNLEKVKLEEILSIEQGLNSIVHMEKLIDFVIDKTAKILEADKCSLIFFDANTQELAIKGSIGVDNQFIVENKYNAENSITGFVVDKGIPVLVEDIETDERFSRQNRPTYKSKSFISIPIKLGDEILGVINVADKKSGDSDIFSEIDLKALIMIVRQVAIAIENAKIYKELNYLTITDPLTDIYNFRHFSKTLDHEIKRLKRNKESLCLLLIDVDDFKSYNDTYGHLAGDALLKNMSKVLKETLRETDIACRYAGDEFVVILPATDVSQAKIAAEKIKNKFENVTLERKVTLSIGISDCARNMDRFDLVRKADINLYEAKKQGKNRVSASFNQLS